MDTREIVIYIYDIERLVIDYIIFLMSIIFTMLTNKDSVCTSHNGL